MAKLHPALVVLVLSPTVMAGELPAATSRADLGVVTRMPAVLSPDGRRVLYVRREQGPQGRYAYHIVGADGKDDRKVFASTVGWEDLFPGYLVPGVWSPDGSTFLALTSHNGKSVRQGGQPISVICHVETGKITPLAHEKPAVCGAVFATDGSVYYLDSPLPKALGRAGVVSLLKRYDPKRDAVSVLKRFQGWCPVFPRMSPDRSRIGGLAVSKGQSTPRLALWAYDVRSKASELTGPLRMDDYIFGGLPWLAWSLDGKALYTNAAQGERQHPFSIACFRPFAKAKPATPTQLAKIHKWIAQLGDEDWKVRDAATKQLNAAGDAAANLLTHAAKSATDAEVKMRAGRILAKIAGKVTWLQRDKSLAVTAALAPGWVALLSKHGTTREKAFVLDVAADKAEPWAGEDVLLHRRGNVGLFAGPRTGRLSVVQFAAK